MEKGSVFDDALDDKEFEGNLIYLFRSASDFIKNNSKVRFYKDVEYRVDKPDYAERAVTEALVNALIHIDYIVLGSEVHIDMYDDRLEISSPGGMFDGKAVQEHTIADIGSMRRNPVIADLFHRMKFMERRGSGLKKIISEIEKLPGYNESLKPIFYSDGSSFRVILKNVNYGTTKVSDKLNEKEKCFFNVLMTLAKQHDFVTTKVVAEAAGMPEATTRRYLAKFSKMDIIVSDGKNRSKKYWYCQ